MRKRPMPILRIALLVLLTCATVRAGSLTFSGVLGNSGEQGTSLVKFGLTPAHGLGVVYDKYGTLWDRAGEGVLNRYALDGRLIATYPIAKISAGADSIALDGDQVVLFLNKKLYALPVDAPAGTEPTNLGIEADQVSRSAVGGKLALRRDDNLILLDLASKSETPVSASAVAGIHAIELRPDGAVVAEENDKKVHLFHDGQEVTDGWPRPTPGSPLQFLENYWYGFNGNGTIRRFTAEFEADPGVVLGGASGSFIGHVDGYPEVGSGMAALGGDNFAVSGSSGIMHLIHWNKEKLQMEVVRRIGAIPVCNGLALNRQGRIWFNMGRWEWKDSPITPLQECTVGVELGQVSMLPNDSFVAASNRSGMNIVTDDLTSDAHWSKLEHEQPLLQASVIYADDQKREIFLATDSQGHASAYGIGSKGDFRNVIGPVTLTAAQPVREWTSLAMKDKDTMLAGADGQVLELTRDGANWRESKRWNTWGEGADARFGGKIYLSTDGGHLWVSDTMRHRVICFSLSTGFSIASYGKLDEAGNDLAHLDSPQVIIGREKRAVLFDSGNQRLVKLTLTE